VTRGKNTRLRQKSQDRKARYPRGLWVINHNIRRGLFLRLTDLDPVTALQAGLNEAPDHELSNWRTLLLPTENPLANVLC
jgi:hypothetical protein